MADTEMDLAGVRAYYKVDPVAKLVFDHLGTFVTNMSTTKVDQLSWRLSSEQDAPDRWQIIRFFRKLEQLGCGWLIEGRRGKKTRFSWSAGLVDVSHAAMGQDVKIGPAPGLQDSEAEDDVGNPRQVSLAEHPYLLRKDLQVRLRLPEDLTRIEAGRLAAFIQTLPLGVGETAPTAKSSAGGAGAEIDGRA
ncbi:MAG: hypothetical protein WBP65_13890 [Candidatus Sulfotelmatobacter sp.]|jgi:hypothetical protein